MFTYGFIPNLSPSTCKNASIIIGNSITWHYLSRPKDLAFHDLTKGKVVPKIAKELLGLSRTFIPVKNQSIDFKGLEVNLEMFERDLNLKTWFAGSPLDHKPPPLYVKSIWRPPPGSIPREVNNRLAQFFNLLRSAFVKRRGVPNLLPYQHRLLTWLKHHEIWIIANTDKNLGPCVIELAQYIQNALSRMDNPDLYEPLTKAEAEAEALRIEGEINAWVVLAKRRTEIDADEYK